MAIILSAEAETTLASNKAVSILATMAYAVSAPRVLFSRQDELAKPCGSDRIEGGVNDPSVGVDHSTRIFGTLFPYISETATSGSTSTRLFASPVCCCTEVIVNTLG
jgi:hypothetical protein